MHDSREFEKYQCGTATVGANVGDSDGDSVGDSDGDSVGDWLVGAKVGLDVVGKDVGLLVGGEGAMAYTPGCAPSCYFFRKQKTDHSCRRNKTDGGMRMRTQNKQSNNNQVKY